MKGIVKRAACAGMFGDRLIAGGAMFVLLVLALTGHLAGTGSFWLPKWLTILAGALGITSLALVRGRGLTAASLGWHDLLKISTVLYFIFMGYSSPDAKGAVLVLLCISGLTVFYLYFRQAGGEMVTRWLPAAAMVSILVSILFDFLPPIRLGGYGNENIHTETILMLLPISFLWSLGDNRWKQAMPVSVGGLAVVYMILVNESFMELTLVPAALLAFLAGRGHVGKSFSVLIMSVIGLLFLYGLILMGKWPDGVGVPESLSFRAEIAWNSILLWLDAPLFGKGLGAFLYHYPSYEQAYTSHFSFQTDGVSQLLDIVVFYAHNEYLQLLVNGGIVGMVLVAGAVAGSVRRGMVQSRPERGILFMAVFLLLLIGAVDFPLHNPSTALLSFITFGLLENRRAFIAASDEQGEIMRVGPVLRCLGLLLMGGLSAGLLIGGKDAVMASRHYLQAMQMREHRPEKAVQQITLALNAFSLFPEVRLAAYPLYARAQATGRVSTSDREEADRLFLLSQSASPQEVSLLLPRFLNLLQQPEDRQSELENIAAQVRQNLPEMALGYLMEALVAARSGKMDQANKLLAESNSYPFTNEIEVYWSEEIEKLLSKEPQ